MREISLLGTPKVTNTDGDVPRFRSQRTIALLGYLVAERRTFTRERLAALFWPDDPPEKAKANLRRELYNLAQMLPGCWQTDRVTVRFEPSAETTVDLDLVRQYEEEEQWQTAADLLRGDFLEGIAVDDDLELETWLLGEQERWRQQAETILSRVIDRHIQQADSAGALDNARKLLGFTPWNEVVHRQVILLLARTGQRGAALRQYTLCRETLLEELGVEPSAETTALYERIKRSQTFAMHNIPAATMPLIGRERELAALEAWLDDPEVRLITITGAGGMGKTRLSLAVAQGEARAWEYPKSGRVRFQDGVYFVRLAPLSEAAQIIFAIARALHFSLQGQDSRPPQQQLFDYLQNKQVLLILDSLEHLLDEVALVTGLLQAAPGVQVIITSRARPHLQGEQILTLNGLECGGTGTSPAARLFLDSARRVQPDFRLRAGDRIHLNRTCRLVDGMPLALILAASWAGSLSMEGIAEEIEGGLDFLQSDARDVPARHRSIQAVFDSAWQRLAVDEQNAYARLSVFVGGFGRDAAQDVSGASLQLLSRLLGQSLLQYDAKDDRYQMHELLRQYAAGRLAESEDGGQAARDAHLAYYRDLAVRGGRRVFGRDSVFWKKRFNHEQGNFAAAIKWGQGHDLHAAVNLASALWIYWFNEGQLREAQRLYESLLTRQSELTDPVRAWLMTAYIMMIWLQGEFEKTEKLATETLELFRNLADDEGMAAAYLQLGTVAYYQRNDLNRLRELMEAALPHARLIPETWYAATILGTLGVALAAQGEYYRAEEKHRESLQLSQEDGDRLTALYTLLDIAALAELRGDLEEAGRLCKRILAEARDLDDIRIEATALTQLGQIATGQGDWPAAIAYLEDAIAFQEAASFQIDLTRSLIALGAARLARGERQQAADAYRRAAALALGMASQDGMVISLEGLAQLAWESDRPSEASVRWLAATTAWREASNMAHPPAGQSQYDAILAQMKAHLSGEQFARLWDEGQALALNEALAEALASNTLNLT